MNELIPDEFLVEKAAAIRTLATSLARDVAEIGKHLAEVRERFGRGDNPQFLAWALDTLGWSQATVYRYIKIYKFSQTSDFINVDKIDLDVSSLYLLAAPSTSDEVRAEVIEQATTGTEKVTHKTVKKTVARHTQAKKEKAAPVDRLWVEVAKAVEDEAPTEPHYMLVKPDEMPPIVHVDPPAPADDFMIGHLREEIGARDEEIDELKSSISGFVTIVKEKEDEIALLMALNARLEDRVRRMETERAERADEFAAFLLDHVVLEGDVKLLLDGAQGHLPEVAGALERVLAAKQQPAEPAEPAPPTQPDVLETDAQTWDQFVDTYRATETPLPENHPKLIAGMVHWADERNIDVEQLAGAPKEANEIWSGTAKNFRGQTVAGNSQREYTAKILQRFGDERRHSITAMASSLGLKEKFLAGVLDMMFRADFKAMIAREPDGKSWKYTIRRPAKEAAE